MKNLKKYFIEKVKKPTAVIIISKKTGEIFNFKSLYVAAKKVGINPQIIKDLKIKEDTFLVIKE